MFLADISCAQLLLLLDFPVFVYRHHLCRSFSSMSVAACPLSRSPGFSPRLPVDFDALEEVLKPAVDDGRLLVDLADLKNAPKVPRLDVDFWWLFAASFDFCDFFPERFGGTASLNARLFLGTACKIGVDAGFGSCVGSSGGASSSIRIRSPCPRAQETTDRKRGALDFDA
jgi:hypothetical protein